MQEPQPTCFMRGTGGTIFKMDIPAPGTTARERWDDAIARGDLTPVEHAVEEIRADGSQHWIDPTAPEPKPKNRTRGGKAAAEESKKTEPVTPPAKSGMTEAEFDQSIAEGMISAGDVVFVHSGDKYYLGILATGPAGHFGLDDAAVFDTDDAFRSSCTAGEIVDCHPTDGSIGFAIGEIDEIAAWNWPYEPDALA